VAKSGQLHTPPTGAKLVHDDYLLGRAVQTKKYLRKARSASANEWRFSRFLPMLFRTTSATWREKQIPVGEICSEVSFVLNRNYFPEADFWPGITSA
jgi:hypothetical protein